MGKILNEEEINKIKEDLSTGTSPKRRSAAKKIGKFDIKQLGDILLQSYIKEKKDKRTWETQVEMIRALGKIKFSLALPFMKEVVEDPDSDSGNTAAATIAYIRIKRSDNNDARDILELLKQYPSSIPVMEGCLSVLAFDDMKPSEKEINEILDYVKKKSSYLDSLYIKGTTDPRIHVLSASTNWDRNNPNLKEFLDSASNNALINQYMDRILKGKKAPYGE